MRTKMCRIVFAEKIIFIGRIFKDIKSTYISVDSLFLRAVDKKVPADVSDVNKNVSAIMCRQKMSRQKWVDKKWVDKKWVEKKRVEKNKSTIMCRQKCFDKIVSIKMCRRKMLSKNISPLKLCRKKYTEQMFVDKIVIIEHVANSN